MLINFHLINKRGFYTGLMLVALFAASCGKKKDGRSASNVAVGGAGAGIVVSSPTTSIEELKAKYTQLDDKLSKEIADRMAADEVLGKRIDLVVKALEDLRTVVHAEIKRLDEADKALAASMNTMQQTMTRDFKASISDLSTHLTETFGVSLTTVSSALAALETGTGIDMTKLRENMQKVQDGALEALRSEYNKNTSQLRRDLDAHLAKYAVDKAKYEQDKVAIYSEIKATEERLAQRVAVLESYQAVAQSTLATKGDLAALENVIALSGWTSDAWGGDFELLKLPNQGYSFKTADRTITAAGQPDKIVLSAHGFLSQIQTKFPTELNDFETSLITTYSIVVADIATKTDVKVLSADLSARFTEQKAIFMNSIQGESVKGAAVRRFKAAVTAQVIMTNYTKRIKELVDQTMALGLVDTVTASSACAANPSCMEIINAYNAVLQKVNQETQVMNSMTTATQATLTSQASAATQQNEMITKLQEKTIMQDAILAVMSKDLIEAKQKAVDDLAAASAASAKTLNLAMQEQSAALTAAQNSNAKALEEARTNLQKAHDTQVAAFNDFQTKTNVSLAANSDTAAKAAATALDAANKASADAQKLVADATKSYQDKLNQAQADQTKALNDTKAAVDAAQAAQTADFAALLEAKAAATLLQAKKASDEQIASTEKAIRATIGSEKADTIARLAEQKSEYLAKFTEVNSKISTLQQDMDKAKQDIAKNVGDITEARLNFQSGLEASDKKLQDYKDLQVQELQKVTDQLADTKTKLSDSSRADLETLKNQLTQAGADMDRKIQGQLQTVKTALEAKVSTLSDEQRTNLQKVTSDLANVETRLLAQQKSDFHQLQVENAASAAWMQKALDDSKAAQVAQNEQFQKQISQNTNDLSQNAAKLATVDAQQKTSVDSLTAAIALVSDQVKSNATEYDKYQDMTSALNTKILQNQVFLQAQLDKNQTDAINAQAKNIADQALLLTKVNADNTLRELRDSASEIASLLFDLETNVFRAIDPRQGQLDWYDQVFKDYMAGLKKADGTTSLNCGVVPGKTFANALGWEVYQWMGRLYVEAYLKGTDAFAFPSETARQAQALIYNETDPEKLGYPQILKNYFSLVLRDPSLNETDPSCASKARIKVKEILGSGTVVASQGNKSFALIFDGSDALKRKKMMLMKAIDNTSEKWRVYQTARYGMVAAQVTSAHTYTDDAAGRAERDAAISTAANLDFQNQALGFYDFATSSALYESQKSQMDDFVQGTIQMMGIAQTAAAQDGRLVAVESASNRQAGELALMNTKISDLQNSVKTLTESQAAMTTKLNQTDASIATLTTNLNNLTNSTTASSSSLTQQQNALSAQIAELTSLKVTLTTDLTKIRGDIAANTSQITQSLGNITILQGQMTDANSAVTAVQNQANSTTAQTAALQTQVTNNTAALQNQPATTTGVSKTDFDSLSARLATQESTARAQATTVSELAAWKASVEAAAQGATGGLATLQTLVASNATAAQTAQAATNDRVRKTEDDLKVVVDALMKLAISSGQNNLIPMLQTTSAYKSMGTVRLYPDPVIQNVQHFYGPSIYSVVGMNPVANGNAICSVANVDPGAVIAGDPKGLRQGACWPNFRSIAGNDAQLVNTLSNLTFRITGSADFIRVNSTFTGGGTDVGPANDKYINLTSRTESARSYALSKGKDLNQMFLDGGFNTRVAMLGSNANGIFDIAASLYKPGEDAGVSLFPSFYQMSNIFGYTGYGQFKFTPVRARPIFSANAATDPNAFLNYTSYEYVEGTAWVPASLPGDMAGKESGGYPVQLFSPLILDFINAGKPSTLGLGQGVKFDLNADGKAEEIGWVHGREASFLALDLNKNTRIDDGRELFGEFSRLKTGKRAHNGYEALAEYDLNGDHVIDVKDSVFSQLLVWSDLNKDGISQDKELSTMEQAGIESIGVKYEDVALDQRFDHGNMLRYQAKFYGPKACGKEGCSSYDIYFGATQSVSSR